MSQKLKLEDGKFIRIFYDNQTVGRENVLKIIESYLPKQKPDDEDDLSFSDYFKVKELKFGDEYFYLIDNLYDFSLVLVHDNSKKVRNFVDEIAYGVDSAVRERFFEDYIIDDILEEQFDWIYYGKAKDNIEEGDYNVEVEIEGEKHTVDASVVLWEGDNASVSVSCNGLMKILMELIEKEFKLEKEFFLFSRTTISFSFPTSPFVPRA